MTNNTSWKVNILTLFPAVFESLNVSMCKRAITNNILNLNLVNIRDFATDNYKTVDDTVYGGGAGQLLKPDVLGRAIDSCYNKQNPVGSIIYLSPRGKVFNQQIAEDLSKEPETTFICGHYEGIDQRVIEYYNITELSIGDFILSGGEFALIPIIDAVARLKKGVLGSSDSLNEETFSKQLNGMLEYPQYTKPAVWNNLKVPDILLSGHHKNIQNWRYEQSKLLTQKTRPDLFKK